MRTPAEVEKAGAKVIISGVYALLDTSFGLQVKFDGVHHLEITVPGQYFNKVRRAILLVPSLSLKNMLSAGIPVFIVNSNSNLPGRIETLAGLQTVYDP